MDESGSSHFLAGAGIEAGTLKLAVASVVAVAALLWAAWTSFGLFREWQTGSIDYFQFQWGVVRAAILAMMVVLFIR